MRIYIVGSVASGKTTFSRKLSSKIGIACTHLDGIVHVKDKTNKKWGNTKRSDDEIDRLFNELIKKPKWIIEDAGRKCFSKGMEEADVIVHLKPSKSIRKKRIITRYIKQKLGIEKCIYTPNLRMLKFMFRALNNYETGKDELEMSLRQYSNKVITLRTKREINQYIERKSLKEEML